MTDSTARLRGVFATALGIPLETVTDALAYQSIPQWDSVAHMALVAAIEGEFAILMDAVDVIDLSSVAKAKEILGKYDIAF